MFPKKKSLDERLKELTEQAGKQAVRLSCSVTSKLNSFFSQQKLKECRDFFSSKVLFNANARFPPDVMVFMKGNPS